MEYLILNFYNQIRKLSKIKIASDCSSILRFIIISSKIVSIATPLYPIRREILRIKSTYQIGIEPCKVQAHQDEKQPKNKLLFLEKVNVISNKLAKYLIQQEPWEVVLFLFQLNSPYIMYKDGKISDTNQLYYHIAK